MYNILNSCIRKFVRYFIVGARICNIIYFYSIPSSRKIVVNAWMGVYIGRIKRLNWGDELNYFLIKELSAKKVFNWRQLCIGSYAPDFDNLCCIGSIVEDHTNEHSIIWGAGCMYGNIPLKHKPKKVCAVRGPLTRDYLIGQGVGCPCVYGDPALLLPAIYKPKRKSATKIGIIPHYVDKKNENLHRLLNMEDIVLIDLQNYKKWHDIIDRIAECYFIISSSLHGLIVSDAYGIPNVWVEFSKLNGTGIKFQDYFASVGRKARGAVQIDSFISVANLLEYKKYWTPINIDIRKLLFACPFDLKKEYNLFLCSSDEA